jgi:murein DD-endopeptidase MepM/ murein hydrolase activator NlpD
MRPIGAGRRERKSPRKFLIVILALLAVWLGVAALKPGTTPTVSLTSDLPGIGPLTRIEASASGPGRGLAGVRVELLQGDLTELLFDEEYPTRGAWALWGERTGSQAVTVEVGRESHPALVEGQATVRISAWPAPAWLRRGSPVVEELVLPVRLTPPLVQVVSSHHYVAQGGAEAVVYRVGETAVRDGVEVGERWFPGYPLPGGDDQDRFAIFAAPYDLTDPAAIRLIAVDDVGNEFGRNFVDQYFSRPMRNDDIQLSEGFMEKVVPEILSQSPEVRDQGSLLANYLTINGDLRRINGETLAALGTDSNPSFAWNEVFLQMHNAQVMSAFADRRTYYFEGEAVDQQDHLGFDLASVRRAPIQAANAGRVVLARYFGIYGNTVVVDHGYGLQSLYAHLAEIRVAEGEVVERGQTVGLSGETGLAGGDHLHFTMLLHGLAVNPREWWDAHWLTDRLDLKLGEALPFDPAG